MEFAELSSHALAVTDSSVYSSNSPEKILYALSVGKRNWPTGRVIMVLSRQEVVDVEFALRRVFGKRAFRPLQRDVIDAAIAGHDIFLQAATSFGKSLCFQLPAVVSQGVTLVISPLLALMANQIDALKAAGIHAECLKGETSSEDKRAIRKDLRCGHPLIKLLYVTPEMCQMDHFRDTLRVLYRQREFRRIVVDEAHCVSEWGHDFRKSFLALKFFREEFPRVPITCCTATAIQAVRDDVISTLGLNPKRIKTFLTSSTRPNLHYEVVFKLHDERYEDLKAWLKAIYRRRNEPARAAQIIQAQQRPDHLSGIIYVQSRERTQSIAAQLTKDGLSAKPYHAGLTKEQRADHLRGWVENDPGYSIIVATIAFGMGIDKVDVRFVVHLDMPKSFEGYYQEAGRAGRDGKASACRMYYDSIEGARYSHELDKKQQQLAGKPIPNVENKLQFIECRRRSLDALIAYCECVSSCRHTLIAKYFVDPTQAKCDWACDWHKDAEKLKRDNKCRLDLESYEESTPNSEPRLWVTGEDAPMALSCD